MDSLNKNEARGVLEGAHSILMELLPRLDNLRTEVTLKGDDTPVTAADNLVQSKLEAFLHSRLPNLTFVGEENDAGWHESPSGSGWVAVVDPIDGTENFASALPEWGTAISLFRDGKHAGSMIALP